MARKLAITRAYSPSSSSCCWRRESAAADLTADLLLAAGGRARGRGRDPRGPGPTCVCWSRGVLFLRKKMLEAFARKPGFSCSVGTLRLLAVSSSWSSDLPGWSRIAEIVLTELRWRSLAGAGAGAGGLEHNEDISSALDRSCDMLLLLLLLFSSSSSSLLVASSSSREEQEAAPAPSCVRVVYTSRAADGSGSEGSRSSMALPGERGPGSSGSPTFSKHLVPSIATTRPCLAGFFFLGLFAKTEMRVFKWFFCFR